MIKVFILGSGRMAYNLVHNFASNQVEIGGLWSRNHEKGEFICKKFGLNYFSDLTLIPPDMDVYFVAVSDNGIHEVASQLNVKGLLVHCSGMMDLDQLGTNENRGVFWPVLSLNQEKLADFSEVPICIESDNDINRRLLEVLSDKVSKKTLLVQTEQRNKLHLTAVMVNNFSNHLFHLATIFLEQNHISFDTLIPLITDTCEKVIHVRPKLAQTGPASRKDYITIEKQKELLKNEPELLKFYNLFTESIIHHHKS